MDTAQLCWKEIYLLRPGRIGRLRILKALYLAVQGFLFLTRVILFDVLETSCYHNVP